MIFSDIDKKKQLLDSKRPLPEATIKSLKENILLEWTYNSNAIEGNTLTLSETKVVLEGITVGGKTMLEHLEVINHKDAILYLEELISEDTMLSEWCIKNIHGLIMKNIDDKNAGIYRLENVLISGAKHRPPQYFLVQEQMEKLIEEYHRVWHTLHPVERAAMLHVEFVRIHPFVDGNGRTARLLLNFELIKTGYPPVIIKKENRLKYYEALDLAHTTGQFGVFISFVAQSVEQSLDFWLEVVG